MISQTKHKKIYVREFLSQKILNFLEACTVAPPLEVVMPAIKNNNLFYFEPDNIFENWSEKLGKVKKFRGSTIANELEPW